MTRFLSGLGALALGLVLLTSTRPSAGAAAGAKLDLLLPLGRIAYQTNEWIDVSVVRSAGEALPKETLTLTLTGTDGSKIAATFALPASKENRATEHLHVNGWLLRPGKFTVEASAGGATASKEIEVVSHVRQSSFRLINWGRAQKQQQLVQGEDSLGYNLFYGHGTGDDDANFLRAGVDFMSNCTMSGGHQMDLRSECDWSDPYVTRGGTMRVTRRAMIDRTRPNVPGVHFYDEPGLTWDKNAATGEVTPHMIPSQVRSYVAAFGHEPLSYHKVDPKNPENAARWKQWATWKLGFMDAAWKEAQFGVAQVRPDYLSVTQSQYGFSAYTDGYYFNVVRSLPVTSGHGGYHDYGPGYFNPSFTLEMARARDYAKPCWYLPTWYGNTTNEQYRLEQYLSFQTNIQGMMSPPDLEPAVNASARQGIVESNQLMKKLGPIFTTMPVTRPPVAMLYSLSQAIHTQTKDMQANYLHQMPQGLNLPFTYLAGRLLTDPFLVIVEEDILDGTLANEHKALVLTSIDYLDPAVVEALESFIQGGGVVLMTGDSTVAIKGAIKLPVTGGLPDQKLIDQLKAEKKDKELGQYYTTAKHIDGARPLAKAIKAELDKAGIKPLLEFQDEEKDARDQAVVVTRQAAGDVEYFFLVNATPDTKDPKNGLTPRSAISTVLLPNDGRPVYDAITGGAISPVKVVNGKLDGKAEANRPDVFHTGGKDPNKMWGVFGFGAGGMSVFARTARPIGGVRLSSPTVTRDLTQEKLPIRLDVAATLIDDKGRTLSGSAPLHIRVIDPLGVTRHELYQATKLGQYSVSLPLAANDPAGKWTVIVREMLNNSEDSLPFEYTPPKRARSIAGATPRAVYAANDLDNVFRFARLFHDVTIVKGTSKFNDAAAERVIKSLEPWGVRCKTMDLAAASKPRTITPEEARTWCGLQYAGKGQVKPGDANPINIAGFAVQGPVILLGNPDDNPIIKYLLTEKFLPYAPVKDTFPGAGRGMIAWQRDGIGRGQESVTLIAYDEAGMSEAVGSAFEAAAGIEPLTKWTLPQTDAISAAKTALGHAPAAEVAWTVPISYRDHVLGFTVAEGKLTAYAIHGDMTQIDTKGKAVNWLTLAPDKWQEVKKGFPATPEQTLTDAAKKQARADRMLKLASSQGGLTAVAYWGGTLRVVDDQGKVKTEQQLPQDVTALGWFDGKLIAGLADGRVMALIVK
jgi:hypothetical protein